MNVVAIRVNILEGLVAVPDASVVGAEDKGGTTGVLPDDGVEQAVAPEAVVVAPEAVVLKEEDPRGTTILAGEELVVGGDAVGKEEGDGEMLGAPLIAALLVALHDEGEAVGLDVAIDEGAGIGAGPMIDVEGILAVGHEVALAPVDAPHGMVAVDASGLGEMALEFGLLDEVIDIEK